MTHPRIVGRNGYLATLPRPWAVLDELAHRGHVLIPLGEYGGISVGLVNAAGIDPGTDERLGTADPRSSDGTALGQ